MQTILYKPRATVEDDTIVNNLFEVSAEFEVVFEQRTGFGVDDPRATELRTHPVAVDLFKSMGSIWCGPGLSSMDVPIILDGYWKIVSFTDGERIYFDYNKLVFDKTIQLSARPDGLGSIQKFLSELKVIMKLFPNTITIENQQMRRIELMDRYSADSFEYKQDIYVDILLR
jgi:hypothetical protein